MEKVQQRSELFNNQCSNHIEARKLTGLQVS